MTQHRGPARGRPPGHGVDPGHELSEPKRLGQVIVCPERQPLDHILQRAGGGQHQDSRLGSLSPHRPADVVPVDAREVTIEHEHVVANHARLDQRLLAVRRQIDGHPVAAQPAGDGLGQPELVFSDQDTHQASMNRRM